LAGLISGFCGAIKAFARFPATWNHVAEKNSRQDKLNLAHLSTRKSFNLLARCAGLTISTGEQRIQMVNALLTACLIAG